MNCPYVYASEYLATFKKTVAMHEMFLSRLAQHPVFRYDTNFRVFLEYDQDLAVRTKNKKELFEVSTLFFFGMLCRYEYVECNLSYFWLS